MGVLMLDLDQFKSINDRFGHAVGDAILGTVGRRIMGTLRASDIRVRWGGEEFLIVLPETDLAKAQVVANGLLREIATATVATPDGPIGSTVSIGITLSRPGETDAAAMIRRADMALYQAKAAGRACVRVVLAVRSACRRRYASFGLESGRDAVSRAFAPGDRAVSRQTQSGAARSPACAQSGPPQHGSAGGAERRARGSADDYSFDAELTTTAKSAVSQVNPGCRRRSCLRRSPETGTGVDRRSPSRRSHDTTTSRSAVFSFSS
jgi:diguanylate cyclase (GGDEF)-like protein